MKAPSRVQQRVVALYVNLEREHAKDAMLAAAEAMLSAGISIAVCVDRGGVPDVGTDDARVEDAELLVTIGGDGTLLRGAKIAAPLSIPILGINTGRLGFLTELDADEAPERLGEALKHGFCGIEERIALHARVNGGEPVFALNDVVIRRGSNARLAPFGLALDGEMLTHLSSDGVVVSTPTGSTGYFLSAGGPVLAPGVDAIGIAALLPHSFFARPLIVPSSATIQLECDNEVMHADLETDGNIVQTLNPGDRVTITRYPLPVKFALTRPRAFFARLQERLQWGVPIKRDRML